MSEETVTITVSLSPGEVVALAKILKLVSESNYRKIAANRAEFYDMQSASDIIMAALTEAGYLSNQPESF